MKKEQGLRVKPSEIAGAGLGLFTAKPFKKNEVSRARTECTFAKRKAFWGGLGSREPEGPGLLARLWMKEEPSRPFPFAPEGRQKGGGKSGKRATCPGFAPRNGCMACNGSELGDG